jgi:divalent metal cation (Fe/Co/Zn/Cd) transporter
MAGLPLADPIVGLLITVAILAVLRGAARDIYRRLMDAVNPDLVDAAEVSVRDVPGVRSVDSVQLRWIGHRAIAMCMSTSIWVLALFGSVAPWKPSA